MRLRRPGCWRAVWAAPAWEIHQDQGPSVNLEESEVGEERGSFEVGPGEGADPQGGPWPQGQQPRHLAETELGPEGTRCRG